jgi:carboxyl-terminal processing protease
MLQSVTDDVKQQYYDPRLIGLDWDAKVREAKEKIDKAESLNRALTAVAVVLDSLHDSHTAFLPPGRPYRHEYGFLIQMIGDRCYVIHVRPGSDAEAKGLKPGDEILAVNGYKPTRDDFSRMHYMFWILRPQQGLRLNLRRPDGSERQIDVTAKFSELQRVRDISGSGFFDLIREMEDEEHLVRVRYEEREKNLLIVKFPEFLPSVAEVETVVKKMRNYEGVILDLRADPGGSEDMLISLLGGMFDSPVKIGDRVRRNGTKPIETKPFRHGFNGKLVVLVDSNSASAAELFARSIQLEKRGVVMGDQTSGKVMEAEYFGHTTSGDTGGAYLYYGAEITTASLIMTDGKSLEHRGVVPDAVALPSAQDLANGCDPVLAKAARQLKVEMSPEEAGKLFPYEWPKD